MYQNVQLHIHSEGGSKILIFAYVINEWPLTKKD